MKYKCYGVRIEYSDKDGAALNIKIPRIAKIGPPIVPPRACGSIFNKPIFFCFFLTGVTEGFISSSIAIPNLT